MIKQFATLSRMLRIIGAFSVVASMSVFLLQDWGNSNDLHRYYLLLSQSVLLAIGGFSLAFLQMKTNFISLDPSIYYMSSVPISLIFVDIFILNIMVILTCFIALIIPTYIITKITPIKAIRFQ